MKNLFTIFLLSLVLLMLLGCTASSQTNGNVQVSPATAPQQNQTQNTTPPAPQQAQNSSPPMQQPVVQANASVNVSVTAPPTTPPNIVNVGGNISVQPDNGGSSDIFANATILHLQAELQCTNNVTGQMIIYSELQQDSGDYISFTNQSIPVDVQIWTTNFGDGMNYVKDRMVYSGTLTMTNSVSVDPFLTTNDRLTIPYSSLTLKDNDHNAGIVDVTVHLPDGKVLTNETGNDFPVFLKVFQTSNGACPVIG